jgi:hypothetical protein
VKYLIVAVILSAAFLLIYLRLRPYINTARRVLGFIREARRMNQGQTIPNTLRPRTSDAERLVRCAACGTWFPAARAIALRATSSNFCSHACLERSAGEETAPRAASSQH